MVEVPSLLYQLDELLERVDFLSVGSNDLVQFLYAVDRGNPRVSGRFDALSAPVLRALKDIADKAREHNKPVTLCGELASQPIGALALVAIGYRSLSLTPSAVGPVKAMLLDLDCRKVAAFLCPLIEKPAGGVPIRAQLEKFAADKRLADLGARTVMAGLVPAIRLLPTPRKDWMPGTKPGMTNRPCCPTRNSMRSSPAMPCWNANSRRRCRPRPTSSCRANSPSSRRWSRR